MKLDNSGFSNEKHRVNRAITAPRVRLIDPDGNPLGVVSISEAIREAEGFGMDLVEISPQADPPVCKILDYGKLRYSIQKKKSEAKKKQKFVEVKEIKFTPMIGAHDMQIKCNAVRKFLSEGNKVKMSLKFRGREISHQEIGVKVLEQVIEAVSEVGKPENTPKLEGKQMIVMLSPIVSK